MASNFPASLDSFTNPSSSDAMDSVSVPHATQHSDLNDAVEALQAKVGADSSGVVSSHDYKIAQLEAGATGGKILQVVRATDTTNRSTTSTSLVDADISVTITPTSSSSNIILVWTCRIKVSGGSTKNEYSLVITDSSNNPISGTDYDILGVRSTAEARFQSTIIGFDSPATTSATTYKGRFSAIIDETITIFNSSLPTGQMFAIEVSA